MALDLVRDNASDNVGWKKFSHAVGVEMLEYINKTSP